MSAWLADLTGELAKEPEWVRDEVDRVLDLLHRAKRLWRRRCPARLPALSAERIAWLDEQHAKWQVADQEFKAAWYALPLSARPPFDGRPLSPRLRAIEAQRGEPLQVTLHRLYWERRLTVIQLAAELGLPATTAREALNLWRLAADERGRADRERRQSLQVFQDGNGSTEPEWPTSAGRPGAD